MGSAPAGALPMRQRLCQVGGPALLEYLLQAGACTSPVDAHRRTPLHYAILFDNAAAAKALLRRGSSRRARPASSRACLRWLARTTAVTWSRVVGIPHP